jgi:2'-5' RNA ligase
VDHGERLVGKRLFLAVDIDDPTREAVGRIAADLRASLGRRGKISWVHPDRMHLTLQFFGQVDPPLEDRIRAALRDPIRLQPFDVSFEGLGRFPASGAPRVLWLGICDGVAGLHSLQSSLERRLEFRGTPGEGFTPHLTLCRFRDSTGARDALRSLTGRARVSQTQLDEISSIRASAGPCRIDRVTLYESRLSPSGPTYLRLAAASLTP